MSEFTFSHRGLTLEVTKGTSFRGDKIVACLSGLPPGPPWHGPVVTIPGYREGMTRGEVKQIAKELADSVIEGQRRPPTTGAR